MRMMLVTFGIAAFAAMAGAGRARAGGMTYPQQSEAQQQGAKAPAGLMERMRNEESLGNLARGSFLQG